MVIYVDIQRACFRDDGFKNDSLCLCIYISVVSSHYFLSRWSQRGWSLVHSHIKSELLLIFTTTKKKKIKRRMAFGAFKQTYEESGFTDGLKRGSYFASKNSIHNI